MEDIAFEEHINVENMESASVGKQPKFNKFLPAVTVLKFEVLSLYIILPVNHDIYYRHLFIYMYIFFFPLEMLWRQWNGF